MRHPNIVPLYDTGEENGRYFLVSAFIHGRTLGAMLKSGETGRLPALEAARIVHRLAEAVAYAHSEGIVHRDIKPDNVMVDGKGEPLLMDFGLATRADAEDVDERLTRDGIVVGTPAYMAPEQAAGNLEAVKPAGDQYALGCTLYKLLTGQTPFAGPPQVQLLLHRSQPPQPPRKLCPDVPRDLETICLKCLEKEPERRYDTAADLAADLERFLRGEPVLARRQSFAYLAGKFVRRYQARLIVAAVIAGAILLGTAAAFIRIDHERTMAVNAEKKTSASAKAATEAADAATASEAKTKALETKAKESEQIALRESYENYIAIAERELTLRNDIDLASRLLDACHESFRGWEWHYLMRMRDGEPLKSDPKQRHERGIWGVSFSSDRRRFVTASYDGTVRVWDANTGGILHIYKGHALSLPLPGMSDLKIPDPKNMIPGFPKLTPGSGSKLLPTVPVNCVSFSPDGQNIASGSLAPGTNPLKPKELRGVVKVWNAKTGNHVATFSDQIGIVLSLAYSPDGKHIASSSFNDDYSFAVWDAKTAAVVKVIRGHTSHVHRLRYSPDGRFIAAGDNVGNLRLWDAATFELVREIPAHYAAIMDVTFSPSSDRVATASTDGTVLLWDVNTGIKVKELRGHYGDALAVTFSPDGKRIATGGYDNTVRLWDPETEREMLTLRGHTDMVQGLAFSPDGSKLVSASFDSDFRIWDTTPRVESPSPGIFTITSLNDRVNAVAFSKNDDLLASGCWDNTVRLWDGHTGALRQTLAGHTAGVFGVAFNPDGSRVVSASLDRTVKVWDTRTGRDIFTFTRHTAPVQSVAFSPDGKRVASTGGDGRVLIWDAETGRNVITCEKIFDVALPSVSVAFSADGSRIATGAPTGKLSSGTPNPAKIF